MEGRSLAVAGELRGPAGSDLAQLLWGKDAEEDEEAFEVIFEADGVQFLADTAEGADLYG